MSIELGQSRIVLPQLLTHTFSRYMGFMVLLLKSALSADITLTGRERQSAECRSCTHTLYLRIIYGMVLRSGYKWLNRARMA